MDDYEYSDVKEPRRRKHRAGLMWNILTIVVLLVTLLIAVVFLLIYVNPNTSLNPFPPATGYPTATPTIASRITIVPTWTPTVAASTPTDTPEPTPTPLVTSAVVAIPTAAPTSTPVTNSDYAFTVQQGSPDAIDGAQFHPQAGCKWTGVAGQATSLNGEAVKGLFVQLGGNSTDGKSTDSLTMTGLAPQYGTGGFEITLSDAPLASSGTLWIQLLDQQNLPLSDRVYFDTYDDCTKNLTIIYFDQIR